MHTYTIRCIVAFILLSLVTSCKEDPLEPDYYGSISGNVRDAETGVLLEGVSITTTPATEAVLTGVDGAFFITDIPIGSYSVSASKLDYRKGNIGVEVREGRTASASILLEKVSTVNTPPGRPYEPTPVDVATGQERTVTLHWRAADPDRDSIYYDVFVYADKIIEPIRTYTGITDTLIEVSRLHFGTTYRWQVVVHDDREGKSTGDIWSFSTRPFPDNRFVFASARDGNSEIYSSDTSEYNTVRLIENPARDQWPRWNRWRSKIAFVSDREGAYNIYAMKPDGSELQRLTAVPIAGYHNDGIGFCWSPDGGWLFYSHYESLYRIDQFGTNRVLISLAPQDRHYREVEWSPQGDRMVVHAVGSLSYESEINILNPDGSTQSVLVGDVPGTLASPSFSIDGRHVLYTQDLSGFEALDGRQLNTHIMLMSVDQKDTIDVSINKPDGTNDLKPRFSPDGAWIVFINAPNDGSSPGDMWIMRRDGSGRRKAMEQVSYADWK